MRLPLLNIIVSYIVSDTQFGNVFYLNCVSLIAKNCLYSFSLAVFVPDTMNKTLLIWVYLQRYNKYVPTQNLPLYNYTEQIYELKIISQMLLGKTCEHVNLKVACNARTYTFKKNPAYGRHQLSRPMRIVGPIQIWRGCVIYLTKKI